MKKVEDLIPKNKFDFNGMEELKSLSDEEIIPALPELLIWMKDMNWLVAKEMPDLLASHPQAVIPYIIEILKEEQLECDWKTNIIQTLLPLFDEKYLRMLKPSLERIINNPTLNNPTFGEREEETNTAAENLIRKII